MKAKFLQPQDEFYTRLGGSYRVVTVTKKGEYHVRIAAESLTNRFHVVTDYLADADVTLLPKRVEAAR